MIDLKGIKTWTKSIFDQMGLWPGVALVFFFFLIVYIFYEILEFEPKILEKKNDFLFYILFEKFLIVKRYYFS